MHMHFSSSKVAPNKLYFEVYSGEALNGFTDGGLSAGLLMTVDALSHCGTTACLNSSPTSSLQLEVSQCISSHGAILNRSERGPRNGNSNQKLRQNGSGTFGKQKVSGSLVSQR